MARIGSKYSQPVTLDEGQAAGDAERRVDVGQVVGGVGLAARRIGAPRDPRELPARDARLTARRDEHDPDRQLDVLEVRAGDPLPDGLETITTAAAMMSSALDHA